MTQEERLQLPASDPNADAKRRALFIGAGIIFVSLAYPDSGIGRRPLQFLLKDYVHLAPTAISTFFWLANIPSWCKPVLGILSDSIPLFGTRRRYYVMLAASVGVLLWALMSVVPHAFAPLLGVAVCINAMATVGGTINGAIVVEEGQRQGATGRFASLRSVSLSAGSIVAGPVGGWLASRAIGWTCAAGAMLMASLVCLAAYCLREPRTAVRNTDAWDSAKRHLLSLYYCGPLWTAGILMFFFQLAPGFGTALLFYQTDVLHFSKQFIGILDGTASACSVVGGVAYFTLCRRVNLRWLLATCIALNAVATFTYLAYRTSASAMFIVGFGGVAGTLGFLALFDLAARATPRGSEAMGYSILYAFINFAMGVSDMTGSWLFEFFHRQFAPLVLLNGGTTAIILLFIPFLPAVLVNRKDGEQAKG
jgi:MFS family permease